MGVDDVAQIKELLYEKKLLVFRDQHLDYNSYLGFAEKLGVIARYPFSSGLPDYPQIVQIKKRPEQTINFSGMWHVDSTYLETPPDITILSAEVTPPIGGDTVFSNSTLAFEELSDEFKSVLTSLNCNYVSDLHNQDRTKHLLKSDEKRVYKAVHPAIKKHPVTHKSSIYVNEEHTHSFVGMSRQESVPIINYLCEHLKKSEYTLRVKWETGSIAVWDNRAVQHHAVNDYTGHLRIMNRITLNDFII
ncbi:TauD/TfdA family dioxygenase [Enterobacter asburiae]|uniref:TauD/TfdA dioxygenase family protein n=1 Tax=Enterobacter asburiae TaxID=61645 RepID=UPI002FCDF633